MNNFNLSEPITILLMVMGYHFTNGLLAFYVDHATCNDPSPLDQTISKLYLNSIKFP